MKLVAPHNMYKQSFIAAVREYQAENQQARSDVYELNVTELEKDFNSYITLLEDNANGKQLPEGYVPQTTFWLIDNDEFIGRVSIRHYLSEWLKVEGGHIGYDIRPSKRKQGYGTKILELALQEAQKLGISKALVTCDVTNIGSNKIIQANGGILQDQITMGSNKPDKMRYWITL